MNSYVVVGIHCFTTLGLSMTLLSTKNILHTYLFLYLLVTFTVLRTVLTDFKNKHDLDIYDLRNAQNFAKIL